MEKCSWIIFLESFSPCVFIRRDQGLDANQKCPVLTFVAADARPTDAEREVWEQVDVVLKDAKGILDELQAYKGAGVEIREVAPPTHAAFPCSPTLPLIFLPFPGHPEPQRRGAPGAGVGRRGSPGGEAEEVLRVLPEIRYPSAPLSLLRDSLFRTASEQKWGGATDVLVSKRPL